MRVDSTGDMSVGIDKTPAKDVEMPVQNNNIPTTKRFTPFQKFPPEIKQMIFQEAASVPHFHLLFVNADDDHYPIPFRKNDHPVLDVTSPRYWKQENHEALEKIKPFLEPRLPLSGVDDRLDLSSTSVHAKVAINVAIRRDSKNWKRIGEPAEVPPLINTSTDLVWLVFVDRKKPAMRLDPARSSIYPYPLGPEGLSFTNLYDHRIWETVSRFLDPHEYNFHQFAGVKRVAIDLWPHPDVLQDSGHRAPDYLLRQLGDKTVGYDFGALCYLLKHFRDLETVYFLNAEIKTPHFVPDGEPWSRYRLHGPVDPCIYEPSQNCPLKPGKICRHESRQISRLDWSGVEDPATLDSRKDDIFYCRSPERGALGQFTELRAPVHHLRWLDRFISIIRKLYLRVNDKTDRMATKDLDDAARTRRRQREAVEFKLLTWNLVESTQ